MRLIYKATLYYLIITAIVFSIGGMMTYNIFQAQIKRETDRYLIERLRSMNDNYANGDFLAFIDAKVSVDTLDEKPEKLGYESMVFTDTIVMHAFLKRLENNRKMTLNKEIEGDFLRISVHDVIVESDDIYEGAFTAQTRLFSILGIVMVISSFVFGRILFKPFDRTLKGIKEFNIKDLKALKLGKTSTKEFKLLNQFIEKMTLKVSNDYKSLKEFTENASHEFQTPLAIAKGKMELLLQSPDLRDDQLKLIQSSYQAIDHLSKVGHSLALLTRIENREYSDWQIVEVRKMMKDVMDGFGELITLKGIQLKPELNNEISLHNDPTLIRILLSNLFQNAIRYNIENGKINATIIGDRVEISNTGDELTIPPSQLFGRFKKDNQSAGSTGLGLSIVKKICDLGGYQIDYDYKNGWHLIGIDFKTAVKQ